MNRLTPGNLKAVLWVLLTAVVFALPWWLVPADPMPAAGTREFACMPAASTSPAVATNSSGPQSAGGAPAALYSTSPTQGEP